MEILLKTTLLRKHKTNFSIPQSASKDSEDVLGGFIKANQYILILFDSDEGKVEKGNRLQIYG